MFNFLRTKTRHRMRPLGEVDPEDTRSSVMEETPDAAHVMRRRLASLDARERKVVLMHVEEGRSLKEIASALKMAVPQTRACYYQALGRLRHLPARGRVTQ